MPKSYENYGMYFSKETFWDKVKKYAKKAGRPIIIHAMTLYHTLQDSDTPKWAKAIIIGVLGYFIFPIDAIPDVIPVVGFTDDLAAIIAAIAIVEMHIKDEHKKKAEEKWDSLF